MSEQILPDNIPKSASIAQPLSNELQGADAILEFLRKCKADSVYLSKFEFKNCLELIFSLKLIGLHTTQKDWRQFIGPMEFFVITQKDNEELNESSSLWPRMYGKTFLRYVVETFSSLADDEVDSFMGNN